MESPDYERRWVTEYMETQAADETVEHAEKVASERVLGRQYDVWDVHTDKERWWVVTNPTNLYSQRDHRSMDGVLSFHIGLGFRIFARQAREAPDTDQPAMERTRRQWEQAARAQDEADEAEEFRAVGARCRETLLSFAHDLGAADLVPEGQGPPKASDFIHWSELIVAAVGPGSSAARLRSYLRTMAKETWEYVAWLTHAKNAVRFDGQIAIDMVAHFLQLFEATLELQQRGGPDRCPSCRSYKVVADEIYDWDEGTVIKRRLCEACDWNESYEPNRSDRRPPASTTPKATAFFRSGR